MGNSHAFFVVRGAFADTFTGFCVFSAVMAGESLVGEFLFLQIYSHFNPEKMR